MKSIMKTASAIALMLSTVTTVDVTPAYASIEGMNHAFCRGGIGDKETFAHKFERSLQLDPTGNRSLEGCLGTPNDFLAIARQIDPRANLQNASDLAPWVRSWIVADNPNTPRRTSCIHVRADGTHVPLMPCTIRNTRTERNEITYGRRYGQEVLLVAWSTCANLGVQPVPQRIAEEPCDRVEVPSMGVHVAIRIAHIDDVDLEDRCIRFQYAGENTPRDEPTHECPDHYSQVIDGILRDFTCSWTRIETYLSNNVAHRPVRARNYTVSFFTRADGVNVFYLPRSWRHGYFEVCWDLPGRGSTAAAVTGANVVNGVVTITPAMVNALPATWRD